MNTQVMLREKEVKYILKKIIDPHEAVQSNQAGMGQNFSLSLYFLKGKGPLQIIAVTKCDSIPTPGLGKKLILYTVGHTDGHTDGHTVIRC